VRARAVAWVSDEPLPGVVRVEMLDGDGRTHVFVDKAPIFDASNRLRRDSSYPIDVDIACAVVRHVLTDHGRRMLISTAEPWGIETVDGEHEFMMKPDQLHAYEH
jgi:hypothetical protein